MAEYNNFNDFLSVGGTDVSAYIRDVEISRTQETADVTAGSGVTDRKRNTALIEHEITITFVYDDAFVATLLPLIKGKQTVIWGPEGNGSGKPKHEQSFIFTEQSTSGSHEQTDVRVFPVTGVSAAAPTTDFFSGGTFT